MNGLWRASCLCYMGYEGVFINRSNDRVIINSYYSRNVYYRTKVLHTSSMLQSR